MLFICQGSVVASQQQLVHLSTSALLCQQLFSRFFIFLSCLSELSLLPAALKNKIIFRLSSRSLSSIAFGILPNVFTFVNTFLSFLSFRCASLLLDFSHSALLSPRRSSFVERLLLYYQMIIRLSTFLFIFSQCICYSKIFIYFNK